MGEARGQMERLMFRDMGSRLKGRGTLQSRMLGPPVYHRGKGILIRPKYHEGTYHVTSDRKENPHGTRLSCSQIKGKLAAAFLRAEALRYDTL